jgi:hypothetical protein
VAVHIYTQTIAQHVSGDVKPEVAITVFELLMMGGVARNMLSN